MVTAKNLNTTNGGKIKKVALKIDRLELEHRGRGLETGNES